MGSSFLGYVLPWGQISFWGATVITNLLSAIPYFGPDLVFWLWGGFAVDNPTLNRFFSLHFLLPWLIVALVGLHIFYLHRTGSSNPLGICSAPEKVPFHWYFAIKDSFGFIVFACFLSYLIFFKPTLFLEPDNFIPANPMVTPKHIVPEWYFLFAYAILRSAPGKLSGVVALFGSLGMLVFLCFHPMSSMKTLTYYGPVKAYYWCFVACFGLLTVAGSWPVSAPFLLLSRCLSAFYFSWFLWLPILKWLWDSWLGML